MADAVTATKKKYMNFKEIAAYSLGLFGFQAIVGLLNSYQAEFDGSILGANVLSLIHISEPTRRS